MSSINYALDVMLYYVIVIMFRSLLKQELGKAVVFHIIFPL